jgi:hypothetical protein
MCGAAGGVCCSITSILGIILLARPLSPPLPGTWWPICGRDGSLR